MMGILHYSAHLRSRHKILLPAQKAADEGNNIFQEENFLLKASALVRYR